jgi:dTDP-glucose pyrophosphorylase
MITKSDRFKSCQVRENQSLKDAMLALERSGTEIVLIVDETGRLTGIMTDGDIRRALLAEGRLDAPLQPHVQRRYTWVGPQAGRAEVIELMQARSIHEIPVLDQDKRLVGLHLLHELIGQPERPNWAVIMAGGKGTRLRPITENIPKPMIPVAGRPILERIVLHLVGLGFREVFLSVNYLSHIIEEHFGDGEKFGCRIRYLREDEPLGTGGALSLLPNRPTEPVLVMNGDLVTQSRFDRLIEHHEKGGFAATMCVRRYVHAVPFGCISLSDEGHMIGLEEKPLLAQWINAGIYLLSPETIAGVPREFFPVTQLFENLIKDGRRVGAFEIEEDWIDVGQKEQLSKAQGRG